jgi:hypothetical protein
MPTLNQPNLLTRHEIHTRPELWKDKIYYLERNPYWNNSYDFIPIPKKYAEIIREFQQEIKKQKDQQEQAEKDKPKALQIIDRLYQGIKELIQRQITEQENSFIFIDPYELQGEKEKQEQVEQIIKDIQNWFQVKYNFYQEQENGNEQLEKIRPYLQETSFAKFKEWDQVITKILWRPTGQEIIKPGEPAPERKINLLAKWEELNGGQPPIKAAQVRDWLYQKKEQEKELKIKFLKLALTKKTRAQFQKLNQEWGSEEVEKLLHEWKKWEEILKENYNSCFILEHTNEHLKFTFQPPRQIFVNLKEFLFYRSNTWYEVESWERINHINAVITCKRSIFLSYYPYFLSKGINGVVHNSPLLSGEICQCPSFLESTHVEEYECSWEPKYKLFEVVGLGGTSFVKEGGGEMNYAPYIKAVKIDPCVLDTDDWNGFWNSLKNTTYLLLPRDYQDAGTYWNGPGRPQGENIYFVDKQIKQNFTLKNWSEKTRNELNAHTVHHVSIQFYWRKKLLGTYTLADFNPSECYLKIKANGSAILYTLMSKKIFLRWSEDIKTTIEKDRWAGGIMNVLQHWTGFGLSQLTDSLFHDQNTEEDKSESERQTERKTKYTGASKVVSSAMASLPSMLAPSHVKCDYTMAEFALRYEQPSLKLRIEYNSHLFNRYKMEKTLKRNGNEWINEKKAGNYLIRKGYWKIVPHIFEGDKDGFFAAIFSQGVYMYEEHPHEYFLEKLEGGKYKSGQLVGGNPQIETVFQRDLEETGGHDNVSQRGGGLFVYKTSYIRKKDSSGGNVFETLMNQANSYRNHSYEDSGKWVFKHPQSWSTEITMDEYAIYEYDLHFYSSNRNNTAGIKGAKKIIAQQISEGDKSEIKVRFIGELEIQKVQDDPNEIGQPLPGGGSELDEMPEIEKENNDNLVKDLEKQGEAEEEKGPEKQPEEELEPEPQLEKSREQEEELEREDEREQEKSKEKQRQKDKQKEEEEEEPEYSGDKER